MGTHCTWLPHTAAIGRFVAIAGRKSTLGLRSGYARNFPRDTFSPAPPTRTMPR